MSYEDDEGYYDPGIEKENENDSVINYEIVRSFSQKKNLGNYETADFFSSYKAIVEPGTSKEELQNISNYLSERAENDVIMKIDPSKFISRQATFAEYRAKQKVLEEKVAELEKFIKEQPAF